MWLNLTTLLGDNLRSAQSDRLQRLCGNGTGSERTNFSPLQRPKYGGFTMRIWLCVGILIASTVSAYADAVAVPEIDALGGLAAMAVVGSIAAVIWDRRKRK